MNDDETYGEFCHALQESRRQQQAHRFDVHHEEIKRLGIPCEWKNNGHHLVLKFNEGMVDFWPANGKWFDRSRRRYGIGFHRLHGKFNF